jgi:4-carboxymuconolactone decarboxylase
MDERERYEAGLKVRREVLGDAHVDAALAKSNEFTGEFQDLLTRYAWGEIWNRPGLSRHIRSLLTVVMLVALNREEELRMHLRAALKNGVSHEEVREALLQSAIYCGVPAANSAFRVAQEIFGEKSLQEL